MNFALSFAAGVLIAGLNALGIAFFVKRAGRGLEQIGVALLFFLVFKLGLTAAALYGVIRSRFYAPAGLLLGVGVVPAALAAGGWVKKRSAAL